MSSNKAKDPNGLIHVDRSSSVWEVLIDRPEKLNGFTPKMMHKLAYAITEFEAVDKARCLLVRAEGANFTAGLDLPKVSEAWKRGETLYPEDAIDIWDLRPPYRRKPMVLAVKGICFTVGVELSLAADIVIAADNCRFSQMEVKRGIMASGGATIRMVQRAGWGNAMRYLLTGDEWDAETALRFGFIQEVVALGTEDSRARVLANKIASEAAPLAVAASRANARSAMEEGTLAALNQFAEIREVLRNSNDAAEGVQSFIEKRPPRFTGT